MRLAEDSGRFIDVVVQVIDVVGPAAAVCEAVKNGISFI